MRDEGYPTDAAADVLAALDAEYAGVLALLDNGVAIERIVSDVPGWVGVDTAWVGEPTDPDTIVLGHTVNLTTGQADGLVVPVGLGLGGRVAVTRRPMWVSDYCAAREISHLFHTQAAAEGIRAMVAVPVVHDGRLFGVLYSANREVTRFGDRAVRELERIAAHMATAQVVAERARYAAEVAVHEERRRLAIDLHDSVGAMLFTLGANVRRLGHETDLDPDIRARLACIEEQVAAASAALRGSLRALHAPPDQVALPVALREHCQAFADRTGVPARMIALTDLPGLADSRVRALADTVREALLNVEKHARATSVVVTVFAAWGGVAVAVADDGMGLHPDRAEPGASADRGGLGLTTIAERLGRIGGTVRLTPAENAGATLQAWVPV
jgi:signal transduction histidine kinase